MDATWLWNKIQTTILVPIWVKKTWNDTTFFVTKCCGGRDTTQGYPPKTDRFAHPPLNTDDEQSNPVHFRCISAHQCNIPLSLPLLWRGVPTLSQKLADKMHSSTLGSVNNGKLSSLALVCVTCTVDTHLIFFNRFYRLSNELLVCCSLHNG